MLTFPFFLIPVLFYLNEILDVIDFDKIVNNVAVVLLNPLLILLDHTVNVLRKTARFIFCTSKEARVLAECCVAKSGDHRRASKLLSLGLAAFAAVPIFLTCTFGLVCCLQSLRPRRQLY